MGQDPQPNSSGSSGAAASEDGASAPKDYRTGPKLDARAIDRLAGLDRAASDAPTWRGWLLGLGSVAFLSLVTPYIEFVLNGSQVTIHLLPTSPLIMLVLFLALQAVLYKLSSTLALPRQDLVLATCMMMVSAAIPGYGFMIYVTGVMANVPYNAQDKAFQEYLLPYINGHLIPDREAVKSFIDGLPADQPIPWQSWVGPYGLWALMAVLVFGMMFAVCSVLRKQWADRERLPFPLAQVPMEMLEGVHGAHERKKPFLQDKFALIGIAIPLVLHSWNAMKDYVNNWPAIPLNFRNLDKTYMTEPPWNAFAPVHVYIFPAVIGLTYLISLEVSFSLWFFYFVQKICAYLAVQMGLGKSHQDFYASGGHKGFMVDQGGGALVAMVLFGFWMSRTHLAEIWARAVGLKPRIEEEDSEGLSPRASLILFAVCFTGSVVWLNYFGFGLGQALLTIVALVIILTGVTRLACEGGLFYVQSDISPASVLDAAFTPLGVGPHTIVPMGMWSRIFTFDWGRTSAMPAMMHSLKLSGDLRLRKKPLVAGIALALAVALVLGFISFMYTAYRNEGGAAQFEGGDSWTVMTAPKTDNKKSATYVSQILSLDAKKDEAFAERAIDAALMRREDARMIQEELIEERKAGSREHLPERLVAQGVMTQAQADELLAQGDLVPPTALPRAAVRDWPRIFWTGLGGVLMVVFMILRTRVFWWPHPIGYVAWMHAEPMAKLWFSIFLGWGLKWAITQYGGYRVYYMLRRLFVGLVVGEVVAAGLWIAIAHFTSHLNAYPIHIN